MGFAAEDGALVVGLHLLLGLPVMRAARSGLIINCSSLVGQISPPFFSTYSATKHALEGYTQGLRYEVSPFGIDVAIVESGPFGTGLLASGQAPERSEVLASYGELAGVPAAMGAHSATFLQRSGSTSRHSQRKKVTKLHGLVSQSR